MKKINEVKIIFCEGSTEMERMVTAFPFQTASGWASALAAVKRDAEDYLPGLAYNKMDVRVGFANGEPYHTLRIDVTASTQDPFPMEDWAD